MPENPEAGVQAPPEVPSSAGYGMEAESLPGELTEDISGATDALRLGPTPVSDVRFLMDNLGVGNLFGDSGIRTFGWVEGGYTGRFDGPGMLSVQPRQNRFGDEFLLNQIGWAIQKPLQQDQFDWGFNMRYFAGADAALGAAKGGIGWPPGDPHFGQDFRDLYLSAHLPILTDGGVDVKVGRMNTIIGYNGFLAPYRPVLLERLSVLLFAGRCLHRLPDRPACQQSTGRLERDDAGRQHVFHACVPTTRTATSVRSITGRPTKRGRG